MWEGSDPVGFPTGPRSPATPSGSGPARLNGEVCAHFQSGLRTRISLGNQLDCEVCGLRIVHFGAECRSERAPDRFVSFTRDRSRRWGKGKMCFC
jgi:hypothetical protein